MKISWNESRSDPEISNDSIITWKYLETTPESLYSRSQLNMLHQPQQKDTVGTRLEIHGMTYADMNFMYNA